MQSEASMQTIEERIVSVLKPDPDQPRKGFDRVIIAAPADNLKAIGARSVAARSQGKVFKKGLRERAGLGLPLDSAIKRLHETAKKAGPFLN